MLKSNSLDIFIILLKLKKQIEDLQARRGQPDIKPDVKEEPPKQEEAIPVSEVKKEDVEIVVKPDQPEEPQEVCYTPVS